MSGFAEKTLMGEISDAKSASRVGQAQGSAPLSKGPLRSTLETDWKHGLADQRALRAFNFCRC